jgi:hypothetical protein
MNVLQTRQLIFPSAQGHDNNRLVRLVLRPKVRQLTRKCNRLHKFYSDAQIHHTMRSLKNLLKSSKMPLTAKYNRLHKNRPFSTKTHSLASCSGETIGKEKEEQRSSPRNQESCSNRISLREHIASGR